MSTEMLDAAASHQAFKAAVNMPLKALTAWLATDESKKVGSKAHEREESLGHQSGRKVVALLGKTQTEFATADTAHARKVVGYIRRHLAQRPDGNISETHWR